MEFLLDSACPKEIEEVTSWGLITGVTTNPSLYGKMADDFVKRLQEILEVSPGVVYTQVIGADDRDDMVRQARWIASQSEKIIVKLPMTNAGIQACVQLKKESLAGTLGSIHNIQYLQDLMSVCRGRIARGDFADFVRDFPAGFAEER